MPAISGSHAAVPGMPTCCCAGGRRRRASSRQPSRRQQRQGRGSRGGRASRMARRRRQRRAAGSRAAKHDAAAALLASVSTLCPVPSFPCFGLPPYGLLLSHLMFMCAISVYPTREHRWSVCAAGDGGGAHAGGGASQQAPAPPVVITRCVARWVQIQAAGAAGVSRNAGSAAAQANARDPPLRHGAGGAAPSPAAGRGHRGGRRGQRLQPAPCHRPRHFRRRCPGRRPLVRRHARRYRHAQRPCRGASKMACCMACCIRARGRSCIRGQASASPVARRPPASHMLFTDLGAPFVGPLASPHANAASTCRTRTTRGPPRPGCAP